MILGVGDLIVWLFFVWIVFLLLIGWVKVLIIWFKYVLFIGILVILLVDGKGVVQIKDSCVIELLVFGIVVCCFVYELLVIGLVVVDVMILVGCG